jgi:hypothetical protein
MDLSMVKVNLMECVVSWNIQMEVSTRVHGPWARNMDRERKFGRVDLALKDTTDKICAVERASSDGQMVKRLRDIGCKTVDMERVPTFGPMAASMMEIGDEDKWTARECSAGPMALSMMDIWNKERSMAVGFTFGIVGSRTLGHFLRANGTVMGRCCIRMGNNIEVSLSMASFTVKVSRCGQMVRFTRAGGKRADAMAKAFTPGLTEAGITEAGRQGGITAKVSWPWQMAKRTRAIGTREKSMDMEYWRGQMERSTMENLKEGNAMVMGVAFGLTVPSMSALGNETNATAVGPW